VITEQEAKVAVAVIAHVGRVLLVRRRVPEGALVWQFPGGEVEPGQSPEQAAVRETLEETGLKVEVASLIGQRVHPKTGREMSYTACVVVDGEAHVADEDELDAVAWVRLEEIPKYVPYGLFEPVGHTSTRPSPSRSARVKPPTTWCGRGLRHAVCSIALQARASASVSMAAAAPWRSQSGSSARVRQLSAMARMMAMVSSAAR
jgi:8-oxo-dGTP diphosphatase